MNKHIRPSERSALDKHILSGLKGTYLLAVRDIAMFPEGDRRRREAETTAASASATVLALFGRCELEALRKEGLQEWERIRALA